MKKIFIVLLCLIGAVGISKAQNLSMNYQMSVPTGSVKNFIDKASFRGFGINYHYFVDKAEHVSVGLDVSIFLKGFASLSASFPFINSIMVFTSFPSIMRSTSS